MQWWTQHREADAAEQERKAAVKKKAAEERTGFHAILGKLSPEEQKMLRDKGLLSLKAEKMIIKGKTSKSKVTKASKK